MADLFTPLFMGRLLFYLPKGEREKRKSHKFLCAHRKMAKDMYNFRKLTTVKLNINPFIIGCAFAKVNKLCYFLLWKKKKGNKKWGGEKGTKKKVFFTCLGRLFFFRITFTRIGFEALPVLPLKRCSNEVSYTIPFFTSHAARDSAKSTRKKMILCITTLP